MGPYDFSGLGDFGAAMPQQMGGPLAGQYFGANLLGQQQHGGFNFSQMSPMQKFGMISPMLGMMQHGGAGAMSPLFGLVGMGLAKHFGAFK